jgi:hypothetical protein
MSTTPPAPPGPGPSPSPWPQVAPSRPRRWPMFASLVVALLAIGLAIGCWLRPLPGTKASPTPPTPSYTSQQIADSKTAACAAFEKIDHAVDLSDAERGNSSDRTAQLAAAALGRQVLDFGSRYLLTKLAEEPATPPELASAIRQQANAYQDLFIGYIDGVSNTDQALQSTINAATETTAKIQRLCK